MKITKYAQSCLMIERDGSRLLIDPGLFVAEKYAVNDLLPVDGVLITHEHWDHANPELLKAIAVSAAVPIVGNVRVKEALGDMISHVVKDGDDMQIGAFTVTAREVPHVDRIDGTPGPRNTGYLIDDVLFHPGDSVHAEDVRADVLAVPLAGPDVSPRDGFDLIRRVGASIVIPIHYDIFPANPTLIAERAKSIVPDVTFVILEDGASAEV